MSNQIPSNKDDSRLKIGPVLELVKNNGDLEKSTKYLMPILIVGVLAAWTLGLYADAAPSVLLWVMACLVAGGAVGFLFGIPKSASHGSSTNEKKDKGVVSSEDAKGGRPNTNLEEVSDWLTKIIVGLGLVHLKDINAYVLKIGHTVAASLTPSRVPSPNEVSVALALVIGFVVLGFLFGYLYTRLFLQGAFQRSDIDTFASYRSASQDVLDEAGKANEPALGVPVVPTADDLKSAQTLFQVAPTDQPQITLAPLRKLAAEYEQVRRDGDYGPERTKKMAEIAQKMKSFGLVAAQYLPQLTQSPSPGERLAAIVALQMRFDPAYINWLAERLVVEPSFPGYQAASAFLARLPTVGRAEAQAIKEAVADAVARRKAANIGPEKTLDALCEKILAFHD
ncbi:hypothetical protein [Pseudomonas koreensis]|uniref:hypothetical protein n=1 Tax=Pseudomonas koreensis TaxID=198620 RepID=UPI0014731815|nr:hypothetical protein [Pseudomonas koreensis]NNA59393.1 hypothetical protein [Pseudomonas koreensis]